MSFHEGLLSQQGVTATGGGVGYDPNEDYWEIRFDTEGNAYNSKPHVPLHPGHTKEKQPMFDIPKVDVPTPPSLLNYGDEYYYQDYVQPPIQSAVNPTQEQFVGTPTGVQTQHGRDVYKTATGENVSEISVTVPIDGKWVNASSIHNGVQLSEDQVVQGIKAGIIQPTSVHDDVQEAITVAQTRSDNIQIDPMSLYNRQGRADYTPQDTYNPNTIWGDPSLESLPDPTMDAYAEQDYYAEQDRQAKIEAQYQALLKAQGIKEDRRAEWDMGSADRQFAKVDAEWEEGNALRVLQQLRLKEIEAKRQEEFAPADFNAEEFSQRIANRPTPTWLGDSEGPMTDENRASIFADTDDFGNPMFDANSFGQTKYDKNAQRQGILDNVMTSEWDKNDEDEIDVFEVLGETGELSKGTQSYVPNPRATDWWNDNAEITYNTKQNFAKAMGVGEDIVNAVMPILGNSGYGILLNPDHPKHQEAKDLFLNLARGASQGLLHDLPQGIIDFGVDSYNLGGVGKYFPIDPKDAQIIGGGYSEEQQKEFESSTAYNLTKFGSQLGVGYLGLAKLLGTANSANKFTRYLKEAIAFTLPGGTLDVTEGNISNMINTTEYKNAVTELMASKVGDDASAFDRFVARLKNMGEELLIGMSIPALYALAKATKSALTDPQAMSRFMQKSPGLVDEPTLGVVQNDGRFPSERGMANMTDSERRLAQKTKTSTELVDLNTTEIQGLLDTAQTQKLIDDAENKATRITLNEQKAEAKTKANLERQAIEDAKPRAEVDELGFYSKAEQALIDLKQVKNTPQDILKYLRKQGVTQGELEDTGLLAMLNAKKASGESVNRDGLLDFISENKVKLKEYQHVGGGSGDEAWDEAFTQALEEITLDDPYYVSGTFGAQDANFVIMDDVEMYQHIIDDFVLDDDNGIALVNALHKAYPDRYPLTKNMEYDKAVAELSELTDSISGHSDEYIATQTAKLRKKVRELSLSDEWDNQLLDRIDEGGVDGLYENERSAVEGEIEGLSRKQYLETPEYEWNVDINDEQFTVRGSEEAGYTIQGPYRTNHEGIRRRVELDAEYSLHDAEIAIRNYAQENGLVDDFLAEQGVYGSGGDTKYSDFTQPGLVMDSYREIPIMSKSTNKTASWSERTFQGGHMDEHDVIGHLRLSDKVDVDGNNVLFIEELQSDWHQQGRRRGYTKTENKKLLAKKHREIESLESEALLDSNQNDLKKLSDQIDQAKRELSEIESGPVPNAPLKQVWDKTGFKRAIEIAVSEDYDRVAWTTSIQQLDLYNKKGWGGVRKTNPDGTVKFKELYENLYDKKLPSIAKKLANEYGGKSGKIKISFDRDWETAFDNAGSPNTPNAEDRIFTSVNYIDITPKVKESIKHGQSSYAVAPIGAGLIGDKQTQTDDGEGLLKIKKKVTKPKNSLLD
jgi:hypothetical protein